MKNEYCPPLSIHFIWHPGDNGKVLPLLNTLRTVLARDKSKPFSRALNIPLFFYSSQVDNLIPANSPSVLATKNIIFIFTSENTVGINEWQQYVEDIQTSESVSIVPIALHQYGLSHRGSLKGVNCIRFYDYSEDQYLIGIAHEIFRYGFSDVQEEAPGASSSIQLFLSHAKADDTGKEFSETIKEFIDSTNMNRFFDSNEISPGFSFEEEIQKHVPLSTLVILQTDAYSSRYWCQREVLLAKRANRPIIVVNCLEKDEDRIFPPASNVPCLHIGGDRPLSREGTLRILSAALLETIRHNYAQSKLKSFREQGWIPSDCQISARPPEIRQVLDWREQGINKVCYPEPPIYPDEADWHRKLDMDVFTPLWNPTDSAALNQLTIGISISDYDISGFQYDHCNQDILSILAQDIARHLLSRSANLIYGGDLRQNGFTQFILDEALILQERLKVDTPPVQNHLAWPLHLSDQETIEWRAKYRNVMETVEYMPPNDIKGRLDLQAFLPGDTPENLYIWSRCLTEMRTQSIQKSNARICVGGRLSKFKGKMPGVLEEILITLDKEKPLYLLGGFGGATREVVDIIVNKQTSGKVDFNWQSNHTVEYSELQDIAMASNNHADYKAINKFLIETNIVDLACRAGLTEEDYLKLLGSCFTDECVHLILKGLTKLKDF